MAKSIASSLAVLLGVPFGALMAQQQDVKFSGPVTGWVPDPPTHSIRLIRGMPGAALLGQKLLSDVAWAAVAPGSSATAIAIRSSGEETTEAVLLQGDAVSVIEGSAGITPPKFSLWSADAKAVILVWDEERAVQTIRITSDSNSAAVSARFAISNLPETGAITAAATAGGDGRLYFAVAGSGVYQVATDGDSSAELILPVADCQVLAAGAGKLWAVDRATNTLNEITASSGYEASVVSSNEDVLNGVAAMRISADQKSLYLANSTSRQIHRMDLSSREIVETTSGQDANLTMLVPLARTSVFLLGLRSSAEEPLYVWDGASRNVYFVPQEGNGQ